MCVRTEVHNPDGVALRCGLLQEWQQVAGQNNMTHMIKRHMSIHPIVRELVSHDSSCGVVDQNVQTICRVADLFCHFCDSLPVTQIALDPLCRICSLLAQLFLNPFYRALDDVFAHAEDEELGDAFAEQGVRASIADAFTAASHYRDFAFDTWGSIE